MTEETNDLKPVAGTDSAPPAALADPFDDVRRVLSSVFPGERVVVWRDAEGNFKFENQGA